MKVLLLAGGWSPEREVSLKGGEQIAAALKEKNVLFTALYGIDALAVGVTFAFLTVPILPAVSFIGVVTFTLSVVGVKVGNVFGCRYKSRAELAGGLILVLMGLKILFEHLGYLNF